MVKLPSGRGPAPLWQRPRGRPTGSLPPPWVLKGAASTCADFTALGHPGLEELRLYNNNLEEMPALDAANLTILELNQNRIPSIPSDYFLKTPALERLIMPGCAAPPHHRRTAAPPHRTAAPPPSLPSPPSPPALGSRLPPRHLSEH